MFDTETVQFLSLPFDIHNGIFGHLDAIDIIALRETCRSMAHIASERTIWTSAVRRICDENTLYMPSFPISTMSALELECAALGSTRWERLVVKQASATEPGQQCVLPVALQRTIMHPPYCYIPGFVEAMEQLYLIPGGRFLITLRSPYLSLWDLDPPACSSRARTLTDSSSSILCNAHCFGAHLSPDGKSIRIVAFRYDEYIHPTTKYHFDVFEIFPASESPIFHNLASLDVTSESNLDYTSVCGNRLVLVYGPIIKVWDFVADGWAAWNAGGPSSQILMSQTTIILIGPESLTVWGIPKLSPGAQHRASKIYSSLSPEKPVLVKEYPGGYTPEESDPCSGICDWYTGSPQPLWFDVIHENEEDIQDFRRFVIEPFNDNRSASFSEIGQFFLPRKQVSMSPYRVNGSNIVALWSTTDKVECHYGAGYPSELNEHSVTATLCEEDDLSPRQFALCPVTGRFCFFGYDKEEIEVVDFLPPLSGGDTTTVILE